MKKLFTIFALVFTTACFAQTIPATNENESLRLEYKGYTTYCNIGYVVGVENYTDSDMDILITWDNGSQIVHVPALGYQVFWFWGEYTENSKIKARVLTQKDISCLQVKVTGNYYF
jgi:hypothetical protein